MVVVFAFEKGRLKGPPCGAEGQAFGQGPAAVNEGAEVLHRSDDNQVHRIAFLPTGLAGGGAREFL